MLSGFNSSTDRQQSLYESLLCTYNFEQTQTHNKTSQHILGFIFTLICYAEALKYAIKRIECDVESKYF